MAKWRELLSKAFTGALGPIIGNLIVSVLKALGLWPFLVAIVAGVIAYVWGVIDGLPGSIAFVLMLAAFVLVLGSVYWIKKLLAKQTGAETESRHEGPTYWSLSETLSWIAFGKAIDAKQWVKKIKDENLVVRPEEEVKKLNESEQALFEKLRGKKLIALGKKDHNELYEEAPAEYFLSDVTCAILHDQIDVNAENIGAKQRWKGPKWRDVRFRRDDVKREWPAPLAIPEKQVRRDVWLLEATHRIACGEWKVRNFDELVEGEIDKFVGVLQRIRQHAFDGDLPIWGKQRRADVWRPIPTEYWENHGIDWFSMLKGNAEELTTEWSNKYRIPVWQELMTSRNKVDELWSKEST